MKRLIIKSLGPITSVDVELNKVNLIIGPQSSGKSTVNKVACFCSWLEKEISIRQDEMFNLPEAIFSSNLIEFHKLEGFANEQTYIHYESDVMSFSFSKKGKGFHFEWKNRWEYKRHKTAYIPAERNIVATIPNWFDIKLKDNSIRSFMSAWEEARNCFQADKKLEILNLGVNYFFDKNKRSDFIKVDDSQILDFTNTSSGLQSLVPLFVVLQYITHELFVKKQDKDSFENLVLLKALAETLYDFYKEEGKTKPAKQADGNTGGYITRVGDHSFELSDKTSANEFTASYNNYANIQGTNIFMEEPEENLFPATQRDLIYTLLQSVTAGYDHNLFLTTHSPFILYALNNCMLAYQVKDKIDDRIKPQLPCLAAGIDPQFVSMWQMKDGELISIKNKESQNLGSHYFNTNMNEILNEYYIMANYL